MTRRTRQVGEFLREELTDIIRREVKDPRIGFMSVTRVDVTPDLRHAAVYISVLGTDEEREETLKALRSSFWVHPPSFETPLADAPDSQHDPDGERR